MGAPYTRALLRTLPCFLNSSPVDISQVFWQNSALWEGEHKSLLSHLPVATLTDHPKPPSFSLSWCRGLAGLSTAVPLIPLQASHVVVRRWLGWCHP